MELSELRCAAIEGVYNTGAYITTVSGKYVYLFNHESDDYSLDIDDIAHSLCQLNRWNGHSPQPISIAWHSLLVSSFAEIAAESRWNQLWCLLHDASEAYLGDVVSPLKDAMPQYRAIENYMQHRIAVRFGVPVYNVKRYDHMALSVEDKLLRGGGLGLSYPPLFNLFSHWCGGGQCTPQQFRSRFDALIED